MAFISNSMDNIDVDILNIIQSDFPIISSPFLNIAKKVGLTEEDVLRRLKRLKENGIIRRIGANFVPEKLGFVSTLCAAKVPEDKIDFFAEVVNRFPGVTHNYLRDDTYNIWFTFIASSMQEIKANLEKIAKETNIKNIINLPSTKVFKIKALFDLSQI